MRMTAIHAQTERKRQDRSTRCAEKRSCRARTRRLRGLIRPVPGVSTTEDAGRGEKRLSGRADLGDIHVNRHTTWGISDELKAQQMTNNSTKFSKVFWFSYWFSIVWSGFTICTFVLHQNNSPIISAPPDIDSTLSGMFIYRRIFTAFVIATTSSFLIFTRNHHLDKFLIFVCAWMWASYIDDRFVRHAVLFVPDLLALKAAILLRPLALMAVSWMTFEAYLRAEAGKRYG